MCLQLVCFSCVQARRKAVKELFFGFCLKMCLCFASDIFSFFNVCFCFVTVVSGTPPRKVIFCNGKKTPFEDVFPIEDGDILWLC